jgi:hypothetical protein
MNQDPVGIDGVLFLEGEHGRAKQRPALGRTTVVAPWPLQPERLPRVSASG